MANCRCCTQPTRLGHAKSTEIGKAAAAAWAEQQQLRNVVSDVPSLTILSSWSLAVFTSGFVCIIACCDIDKILVTPVWASFSLKLEMLRSNVTLLHASMYLEFRLRPEDSTCHVRRDVSIYGVSGHSTAHAAKAHFSNHSCKGRPGTATSRYPQNKPPTICL